MTTLKDACDASVELSAISDQYVYIMHDEHSPFVIIDGSFTPAQLRVIAERIERLYPPT